MTVEHSDPRHAQAAVTRRRIVDAAEELFAVHGVAAVSHRQIAVAAKQGNNAVVGYYFGSKQNLVAAIEAQHVLDIDRRRRQHLARASTTDPLGMWVARLVRPYTEHLAALPQPSSYARFSAKMLTDREYQDAARRDWHRSSALKRTMTGITVSLSDLPETVLSRRNTMAQMLLTHTCADYEAERAVAGPAPHTEWFILGETIIGALIGLWSAPPLALVP